MNIFWTILSGVSVYVLGQILLKLFIDPWQTQRALVADISAHLIFYANVYANPGVGTQERNSEASTEARKLASRLTSTMYSIPAYSFFAKLGLFPTIKDILAARSYLVGLSNATEKSGDSGDNLTRENGIRKLLCLQYDQET